MENNEFNNDKVNLIKKAYAKFKSSKVVQRLAALTLTAATVLTLTYCDETPKEPDKPSFNIGGVHNNNNNENNNNENKKPIDVSGYSQILQNILLNEHYNSMISQIESTHRFDIWETGVFEPHPYAFFETEGFDVEAIKNDEIDAYTMSFVLDEEPNNLYMYTRVMQDNSYWTNYLLKYELTEQEMDDYHYLHTGEGKVDYFIQSVFMNNEISKTRKPEIIGKSNISIETFDDMTESHQIFNALFNNKDEINIIFLNPNNNNRTYDMFIIPSFNDKYQICFNSKVVRGDGRSSDMNFKNNVYMGPSNYSSSMLLENRKNYTATYYFSQDAKMNYIQCESLDSYKNK